MPETPRDRLREIVLQRGGERRDFGGFDRVSFRGSFSVIHATTIPSARGGANIVQGCSGDSALSFSGSRRVDAIRV
jgi:hypothetical protein